MSLEGLGVSPRRSASLRGSCAKNIREKQIKLLSRSLSFRVRILGIVAGRAGDRDQFAATCLVTGNSALSGPRCRGASNVERQEGKKNHVQTS